MCYSEFDVDNVCGVPHTHRLLEYGGRGVFLAAKGCGDDVSTLIPELHALTTNAEV